MNIVELIPFAIVLMTLWDFTIHVIDKRDRKYRLSNREDKTWSQKMKNNKSVLSYYYPHFWGKKPVSDEMAWKRYDYFWLSYWGGATILLIVYITFR